MRKLRLLLFAALALSACSDSRVPTFRGLSLQSLGGEPVLLAACPTAKCVTVYVAPWCGYCRRATPLIKALRERLNARGIASRVAVGMDGPGPVKEYARAFGRDTLLDPDNKLGVSAVPHFYLSDAEGRIVGDLAGAPNTVEEAEAWALQ